MFRFVGFVVVMAGSFGIGYYLGNQPGPTLQQTILNVSRHALDTALGIGFPTSVGRRDELLNAKGKVIQAKSDLLDRNFGNATRELAEVLEDLQSARLAEQNPHRIDALRTVSAKVRKARGDLLRGKRVSHSRLDEIQQEVDRLLAG